MMKALVFDGPGLRAWRKVPLPRILHPTDAIVKISATTICGTDIHILKGDTPSVKPGTILGHEGIGYIDSVGSAVTKFSKGQKVIISCITSCGRCVYCLRKMQAHCNDGGWRLGNEINGTQAEYIRIPHATNSLLAAPADVPDEALLMLSDALPTGNEVGSISGKITKGDVVAIVGCGPVGIASLLTAKVFEPAAVVMIDTDNERLLVAKNVFGATHTINPSSIKGLVLDEINKITDEFANEREGLKPGVDVAIECVGIPQTFATCQEIIAPGGRIANVGVHGTKVDLELQNLWIKNINISTGLVSAFSTPTLLQNVKDGVLNPQKLITHRFKLDDIEKAYETFENASKEKCIKTILIAD